jgi:Rhodopirellula transposase DDE domain
VLITAGPELAPATWQTAGDLAATGVLDTVLVLRPTAAAGAPADAKPRPVLPGVTTAYLDAAAQHATRPAFSARPPVRRISRRCSTPAAPPAHPSWPHDTIHAHRGVAQQRPDPGSRPAADLGSRRRARPRPTWRPTRGRPLETHEVVVETIAATTTKTGLSIQAELDTNTYPRGIKITDKEMKAFEAVHLQRHEFHGDWNYTVTAAPG